MLDAAASDRQILHVSAVAAPEELLKYLSATQQRPAEGPGHPPSISRVTA